MNEEEKNKLKELITNLCHLLLIEGEEFDENGISDYLRTITAKESVLLNNSSALYSSYVKVYVRNEIRVYLETVKNPFAFDVSINFAQIKVFLIQNYKNLNNNADCPLHIRYVFSAIESASDTYAILDKTYSVRDKNIKEQIEKIVETKTEDTIKDDLTTAVEKAVKKVGEQTDKIQKELAEKTSETSITILGIFSAIVLVANTFLAFSDITIETFISASPYRAFFTILIFSFVFANISFWLIWVLQKKKNHQKSKSPAKPVFIVVNSVLIALMLILSITWLFFGIEKRNQRMEDWKAGISVSVGSTDPTDIEIITKNDTTLS